MFFSGADFGNAIPFFELLRAIGQCHIEMALPSTTILWEGCAWKGAGRLWELSVLSAQFCCEPETALKEIMKSFYKNDRTDPSVVTQLGFSPSFMESHELETTSLVK